MEHIPIIVEKIYPVPMQKVWQAITDKEQMKEWYFDIPDFRLTEGAIFNFFEAGGQNLYHHKCVIIDIEKGKKLKHTWTHPSHSNGSSELTWMLHSVVNGTKLILTHQGVESFADAGKEFARENYEAGWEEILGKSLKEFLEK